MSSMKLEDKVCVITGAASGIGAALAERFAQEGASVVAADIDDLAGHKLVGSLARKTGHAEDRGHHYVHADVRKVEDVPGMIAGTVERFGKVDVLVNNAGIPGVNKPTHEITADEWNQVIAVNLNGVFLCTKHAIPHMKRAGGGSIINLSSIYGLVGAPDAPPYHAAKGAVRLMSKTDAMIYAPDNIRVNSVHPGFIWTPMVEHFLDEQGDLDEGRRLTAELHPLGRMGDPEDIAYGILYLASDESKFVTGSELVIDGGYTAR